ncbi:acetolactate synthase small subunit [bacterium]|nr:acetolactate synthase small subunit [bacterium]
MRHVISIVVEDQSGALARIVELFTSRGYNLESICSGEAEETGIHRLTLVTKGDDRKIRHIIRLLNNIVYVIEVTHLNPMYSISQELMLMKVKISPKIRSQVLQLIEAFGGTVVEMNLQSVSFRVVGQASKLDGVTQVFRDYKIIEMARTGEAAIHK